VIRVVNCGGLWEVGRVGGGIDFVPSGTPTSLQIVSFDTTSTKGLTNLIEVIVFQLVTARKLEVYLNATTISRCVSVR